MKFFKRHKGKATQEKRRNRTQEGTMNDKIKF
jgi:hypothetical protein